MRYAAVVTAAGLSSRMCEFKPMLPLQKETVIRSTTDNLKAAGVEEILVVTGYRSEELRAHLAGRGLRFAQNEGYAENSMFDSVCIGLRALDPGYDFVLVTPADIPLVKPETIKELMRTEAPLSRPVCNGRTGHPLMIAGGLVPGILAHNGEGGLKGAADALGERFSDIPVDDIGVIMDADRPEEYRRLLELDIGRKMLPAEKAESIFQTKFPNPESVPGLTDAYCEGLLDACAVPEHIKRHCRAVARKADEIAARLPEGLVDRGKLHAAAMLHDLARLQKDHAAAGAEILAELGYGEISAWVAVHHELACTEETVASEEVILYLADKLIREDREVTLEERFSESGKKCRTPEAMAKHRMRYAAALAAESCVAKAEEKAKTAERSR